MDIEEMRTAVAQYDFEIQEEFRREEKEAMDEFNKQIRESIKKFFLSF